MTRPHTGQACTRTDKGFSTKVPQPEEHILDVLRGSTDTTRRPAFSALYVVYVISCFQAASEMLFSQTMILKHVPDSQVFKRDHAETVDQFTTNLMSKVFAPVGNALVDMLNDLALFGSFGRSFFSPREQALHLRQFFLSMTKEAGIFNLHPIGERGKAFKSYVHPDCQAIVGQGLGIHFTGEAGIPVAQRIPLNGECLDPALDGTMQDDPHCPNFGNEQTPCPQGAIRNQTA